MGFIGEILAVPYIIFFFGVWIAASLARPILVVSLACLLANPVDTFRKARLFVISLAYLIACNDKKWKSPKDDPASYFKKEDGEVHVVEKKTIIFVRHGESTWNDTFNRGDRSKVAFIAGFVPGLIWAVAVELYLFVSGQSNESWLFDSPLSYKGVRQATDVKKFLSTKKYITASEAEIMGLMTASSTKDGVAPPSQLVSSNLRRAISTVALGFQDRLERNLTDDNILILPQLQEISRNPDALSITPPKGSVVPSWIDREVNEAYFERLYKEQVDTSLHNGNKPVNTNGLKRLEAFCSVAFNEIKKDTIIAGGHSLWFRSFFRTYLPHNFDHISKKKKLINGGCASFTLMKKSTEAGDKFMIDPKSVNVIYGGF
mmetsp:Transcript_55587/g.166597  ORF Transcript_55587/g.166597 Transcript_55587/m.166597 type:complete len:374 (-) Transcript_55587:326-1447(-)